MHKKEMDSRSKSKDKDREAFEKIKVDMVMRIEGCERGEALDIISKRSEWYRAKKASAVRRKTPW